MKLKHPLFLVFSMLLFLNCEFTQVGSKSQYLNSSIKTDSLNIPIDSTTFYIPISLLHDSSSKHSIDSFEDRWFSIMLYALREPLLYNRPEQKEIYRFTWLRSFHNPISIRIEKSNNQIFLYLKETSGLGGYHPGHIIVNRKIEIPIDKWDNFVYKLKKIDFWNQPPNKFLDGCDGAEWIMEGTTTNDYHIMIRWTEPSSDNYKDCCKYLLGLSGLKIAKKEIY